MNKNMTIPNFSSSMQYKQTPANPIRLIFEILLCILLIIPAVLWATIKLFLKSPRKNIRGQVVLVTGAARGLGRELCTRFHELGAKVVCVDVDGRGCAETAKEINRNGGTAMSYEVDVTNRRQIAAMHTAVRTELGPVDILVNNAGLVSAHMFVNPESEQLIEDLVNVNLLGQIWMNREILPSMLERNQGQIVAISSMSSMSGLSGISTYTATKWATNGMMESLYNELKTLKSTVVSTTVCPYFIKTNPEISEHLELRFPEMPTSFVGKIVMNGILENRRIFSVPNHFMFPVAFVRILPDNLQLLINKIFYVNIIGFQKDKELMKKYQR
ncbi:NAD(P)-binding domain,Short-chain dehydrogenase/reductase SDR [Cinara cedri]|uniref:Short-chain dehydrogenase/reductase 3 n=1 Tax=Cinara cedri TaxID=506608 RepID=A0A5E4M014_9HEMI|nr:NAD(P)-binding domain,Short-chain dehydrogenase/reductase SDR [Cinara cedri]